MKFYNICSSAGGVGVGEDFKGVRSSGEVCVGRSGYGGGGGGGGWVVFYSTHFNLITVSVQVLSVIVDFAFGIVAIL